MSGLASLRLALLVLLLTAPVPAFAATVIGSVTRVQGDCSGTVEGATRTLAEGDPVHLDEAVATAEGGRLAITFDDGTVLTLGAKATVTIDRFVYVPRSQGNAFHASIVGAFRFVSGSLGKTPASTVGVTTPVATVAVRGTDFWGGPIDGLYGVFLTEGAVAVAAGGRETLLDAPGEGMTIAPPRPPLRGAAESAARPVAGAVTVWPADRVSRALASVAFN